MYRDVTPEGSRPIAFLRVTGYNASNGSKMALGRIDLDEVYSLRTGHLRFALKYRSYLDASLASVRDALSDVLLDATASPCCSCRVPHAVSPVEPDN